MKLYLILASLVLLVSISLSEQQNSTNLPRGNEISLGDGDHHHHHHHHHDDKNKDDHHHHHHHHDKDKDDHHHHHHHDHDHHHSTTHHHHHHHSTPKPDKQKDSCDLGSLIPGLDTMQQGVDLASLDFFPMGEKSSNEANGHRESVFSFACRHGRKWSNAALGPKQTQTYSLPDEVQDVRKVASALMQTSVDISKSLRDTQKALEVQAGIGGSCKGIGFSVSGAYKTAKANLLKKRKTVTLTQAHEATYEIELKDKVRLSHKFSKAVKALPSHFSSDPHAYLALLKRFGTHYFGLARFGGSIILRSEFESSFVRSMTSQALSVKLKASFLHVAKMSLKVEAKQKRVDEQFQSQSTSSFFYFGGHSNLAEESRISEWFRSVAASPWLFSGRLVTLDKVIGQHSHIKEKAKEVGKAIKVYLGRKALADLEQTMRWSKRAKMLIESDDSHQKKLERVKQFFGGVNKSFSSKDIGKHLEQLKELLSVAHK